MNILLDENKQLIPLTYILCHADKRPINPIYPVIDFSFNDIENDTPEISFKFYSLIDGEFNDIYKDITDFKLIYIPEWKRYYQIKVSESEGSEGNYKSISGIHLSEAELSQLSLNELEINTEEDILRDDYEITYIYDKENPKQSLMHKILKDKAPHYKIKYVSPSIAKLVRSFSISGTTINDFIRGELCEELNAVVKYDSFDNSISMYDTLKVCRNCGHRGDYNEDYCPECHSNDIYIDYAKDTAIVISTDNLSEELTIDTDKDSVKTCFRIIAGDDLMTSAVRAINPNGTSYIYRFSNEILADMSSELREKIEEYDKEYQRLSPVYKEIMSDIFNLYDEILYYQTEMMPVNPVTDTSTKQECNKLNYWNMGTIGFSTDLKKNTSISTINNGVLGVAKILMSPGYDVEIVSSSYNYSSNGSTWTGKFKVINNAYPDENDTNSPDKPYTGENITLALSNDYETFIKQKLNKALKKEEAIDIFKDAAGNKCWDKYSLDRLSSFENAYQSCLDILMQVGIDETLPNGKICRKLYNSYYKDLIDIRNEINVRQDTIKLLNNRLDVKESEQKRINDILNFEAFIGEDLYKTFCSYRRDDDYQNDNFISDGLSNAELLEKAEELVELANVQLYKASQTKYTISGTIDNFLLMPDFEDIKDSCELGNWIYIQTKYDDVYKLRIKSIGGNYTSFEHLDIEFSNAYKLGSDVIDQLKDTINKVGSMASSYSSIAHQSDKGVQASKTIDAMRTEGLNIAQYKIVNADNQNIVIDEHGFLGREYDDFTETYSDEQIKIINNLLCFTDDNWKTVKTALGKITYTDPRTGGLTDKYGLIADTVISGQLYGNELIGGQIYSSNYWSNKNTGTFIDLDNGDFSLAGGRMKYNVATNELILKNVEIKWDSTNTPEVEIDDVTGLSSFLDTYSIELKEVSNQIDKKAETWYQPNDPSSEWDDDEKEEHIGDLWYNSSPDSQVTSIYSYDSEHGYFWNATNAPADVFDKIDGKSNIFIELPTWYNVGDLLIPQSDIKYTDSEENEYTYKAGHIYKTTENRVHELDKDNFNPTDWSEIGYTDKETYNQLINDLEYGKYKGRDGKTYYFYVKYSPYSDGRNMTDSPESDSKYMGVTSTDSEKAPTDNTKYTWSLIQGKDGKDGIPGNGIVSVTEYYCLSESSITAPTTGWSTKISNPTKEKPYLWNYSITEYTVEEPTETEKHIIANYAKDGTNGKSIVSITNKYAKNNDNTTAPTSWEDDPSSIILDKDNKYLWTYEITTYNIGEPTSTIPHIISMFSEDGKTGKGIKEVREYYYRNNSTTEYPEISSSDWTNELTSPDKDNKYLWNYEQTLYTDGTSEKPTTPIIIANYGEEGRGIKNIIEYYKLSNDGKKAPTSGWSTDISEPTKESPYLWNYEETTYTDNSTSTKTTPKIIVTYSESSYLHIKYSDDGGKSFTKPDGETPGKYIGTYVDENKEDSNELNKYEWKKFVGTDGISATTVVLTNENHTFIGGIISSTTCNVLGFIGTTSKNVTIGEITNPTGITTSVRNNNTTKPIITITVSDSITSETSGSIIIPVAVDDGITINKTFSYSVVFSGKNGENAIVYKLNTNTSSIKKDKDGNVTPHDINGNATCQIGTNAPEKYNGIVRIECLESNGTWKYLIDDGYPFGDEIKYTTMYRVSLYASGTTEFTDNNILDRQTVPVITDGTDGIDGKGEDGKSIDSIIELYQQSNDTPERPTSHTSRGNWSTTIPKYDSKNGKYWYCYEYKWSDGSYSWSTPTEDVTLNEMYNIKNKYEEFNEDVRTVLGLGTTQITKDSIISPKIGGGYLFLEDSASNSCIILDPAGNRTITYPNSPAVLIGAYCNNNPIFTINKDGSAGFKGNITANGGSIAGIDIVNYGGWSAIQSNFEWNSENNGAKKGFCISSLGEIKAAQGVIAGWQMNNWGLISPNGQIQLRSDYFTNNYGIKQTWGIICGSERLYPEDTNPVYQYNASIQLANEGLNFWAHYKTDGDATDVRELQASFAGNGIKYNSFKSGIYLHGGENYINMDTLGSWIAVNGTISSSNGTCTGSDKNLKENISYDIDNKYLDIAKHIDVASFKYIDYQTEHIGVIAQDVLKLFKDNGFNEDEISIVQKMPNGYYGVDYNQINILSMVWLKDIEARLQRIEEKLSIKE